MPPFPRLVSDAPPTEVPSTPHDSPPAADTSPVGGADSYSAEPAAPSDPDRWPLDEEFEEDEPLPGRTSSPRFARPSSVDVRRYAERTVLRSCERIADQLEYAADRIARVAGNRLATADGAGAAPHPAVAWMEDAAVYLRTSDMPALQNDLAARVRDKPFRTLGLALCAGWLLGRIMR